MLFRDSKSCLGFKISQYHHSRTSCREVNRVFSARKYSFMVVAEPPAALWWQAVSRQHPLWYASLSSSAEPNSLPCRREQVMLSGNRAKSMNLFTRLGTSHFCFVCLQQPANCTRGAEKAEAVAEQYTAGSLKKPQQSSEIRCVGCHPHLLSLLVCFPSLPTTFLVHLDSFWVQGTTY